ncbi:MAG: SWIM zinc finger family protein, partial [Deltaproteobacteria bacterium]|nr:SWIM zinc finger family protein [Candidatus Tharpella sp.]
DMAEIFFSEESGLFPAPKDISFDCSCPDWADMCKHVAAVLYGIGARFDDDPQLFFKLRGVNINDLITQAVRDKTASLLKKSNKKSKKIIADADLGAVFGIEMDMESGPDFGKKSASAKKKLSPGKSKVGEKPKKSAKTLKPKRKATGKVKKTSKTPKTLIKNQENAKLAADSSAKIISAALLAAITAAGDNGCSMAQLSAVTGCPKSRLYTIVHRLKQQGKIKSRSRGVYELTS